MASVGGHSEGPPAGGVDRVIDGQQAANGLGLAIRWFVAAEVVLNQIPSLSAVDGFEDLVPSDRFIAVSVGGAQKPVLLVDGQPVDDGPVEVTHELPLLLVDVQERTTKTEGAMLGVAPLNSLFPPSKR